MTWWQYLILANVYLLLFYGFYTVLLRKETFFQLNRFYLVATSILSFLVPLIQSEWVRSLFITQQIKQKIYQLDPVVIYQLQPKSNQHVTIGQTLALIYIGGIVVLGLRLIGQLIVLRKKLANTDKDTAYSFFNTIKLANNLPGRNLILKHEEVHVQQWHSADVLLIELLIIINWFNPAIYLYRHAIKHVHEFIADVNAIKNGTSKKEYALLLLSETFKTPAHHLVNSFFNHSMLKQRILMLQRNRSQRTALLKYGLSAPLFALMLVLTSATTNTVRAISIINKKAAQVLQITAADPTLEQAYQGLSTSANTNLTTTLRAQVETFKPQAEQPPQITLKQDTEAVFTSAEQPASYPGGFSEFARYLAKNFNRQLNGNTQFPDRLYIGFTVEKDGSLSNISVLKDKTPALQQEALRVLANSAKWIPAKQNGLLVRLRYTVPIQFSQTEKSTQALADTTQNFKSKAEQSISPSYSTSNATVTISHLDSSKRTPPTAANTGKGSLTWSINSKSQAKYFINGEAASIEEVQKLKPANIKAISVYKKPEKDLNNSSIIQITTK